MPPGFAPVSMAARLLWLMPAYSASARWVRPFFCRQSLTRFSPTVSAAPAATPPDRQIPPKVTASSSVWLVGA